MKHRSFLLGLAAGFSAGYCAWRTFQALRLVRGGPIEQRDRDPKRYGAHRRALAIAGIARSLATSAYAAYSTFPDRLDRGVRTRWQLLRPITFTACALTLEALFELPVQFVEDYGVERRYGMTEQEASAWFADRLKEAAIGIGISSVLSGGFAEIVRRAPRAWPLYATLFAFPLLVLANVVVPLYILPIFNRFEPLDGELEARIRALATRYGVGDAEILRVDMSRQTKKANAYVTGIGTTHRIVLGDTLLAHFPHDEIEFVVAHELGHYVSKDSWRMIFAAEILTATVAFASARAVSKEAAASGHPRALVRLALWSALLSQMLRPALSAFSRSREWAADRFAVGATGTPQVGASAFERLREQNLAEDEQPAWFEFFFATHPSLRSRIAALRLHQ